MGCSASSLNAALLLLFALSLGVHVGLYFSTHEQPDFVHSLKRMSLLAFAKLGNYSSPSLVFTGSRFVELNNEKKKEEEEVSNLKRYNEITVKQRRPEKLPFSILTTSLISSSPSPSSSIEEGPLESFLRKGGNFPILLLTCNRPTYLTQTLESLYGVHGFQRSNILISQDGNDPAIMNIALKENIQIIQHENTKSHFRMDGAAKIAVHYTFSLTKAFELFPSAPAIIIVEDDLLFAPDFLDFFQSNAPVLDKDSSVFALSAWNDNGFVGKVGGVYDLCRTNFFPGLGWLLTRQLYSTELERNWPETHWDHWLRSSSVSKNRAIVHPSVPRSYHNGVKGTFMDLSTHNRYFRDIAYNRDASLSWASQVAANGEPWYTTTLKKNYLDRIESLIGSCVHLQKVSDLKSLQSSKLVVIQYLL